MHISLRLRLSHSALLLRSSVIRAIRNVIGSRSKNWCTETHHTKSNLTRRIAQLCVLVALAFAISGLAKTGEAKSVQSVPKSPIFELGAPCTTLTDLQESTCDLNIRNDSNAFRRDMMVIGD